MNPLDPAPWQTLADAHERLWDARRAVELGGDDVDRAVAAADLELAAAELARANGAVAALGELLLRAALTEPGAPLQKRLSEVFGGLARSAWEKAQGAQARADWAVRELEALRQRVADLEARAVPDEAPPVRGVVGPLRVYG